MALVHVGKYSGLDSFKFEQLPKGGMFELSMNPYNGNVFVRMNKRVSSYSIALGVLRDIVRACDSLERGGSDDPLRDLLAVCDGSNLETLSKAAGAEILAFSGRRTADDERTAAEGLVCA